MSHFPSTVHDHKREAQWGRARVAQTESNEVIKKYTDKVNEQFNVSSRKEFQLTYEIHNLLHIVPEGTWNEASTTSCPFSWKDELLSRVTRGRPAISSATVHVPVSSSHKSNSPPPKNNTLKIHVFVFLIRFHESKHHCTASTATNSVSSTSSSSVFCLDLTNYHNYALRYYSMLSATWDKHSIRQAFNESRI